MVFEEMPTTDSPPSYDLVIDGHAQLWPSFYVPGHDSNSRLERKMVEGTVSRVPFDVHLARALLLIHHLDNSALM